MAAKKSERKRKGPPGGTRPARYSFNLRLWRDYKRKRQRGTFTHKLVRRLTGGA